MELELYNPQVAFRSCEYCKKYQHDEKTGKPVQNIRTKELLPRTKLETLPCVQDTCPKGHYTKPVHISRRERRIIELYKAARATGGAILNEAERSDNLVMKAFAMLDEIYSHAQSQAVAANVASIILASRQQ